MNIEHLRRSLKVTWLNYYRDNRDWISRLGVWVSADSHRRPSSSFILATLSAIEPQFTTMLPFIVDLTSNPDRIVSALGLDFNPEEQMEALAQAEKPPTAEPVKMLPGGAKAINAGNVTSNHKLVDDSACSGIREASAPRLRS